MKGNITINENIKIENFVFEYKNFVPDGYCDEVIEYFENMLKSGLAKKRSEYSNHAKHLLDDVSVIMGNHDEVKLHHTQTLSNYFLEHFWKNAYPIYSNEYTVLQSVVEHKIHCIKVQKTNVGEAYHAWHFENIGRDYNDRLMTFILYLNDVEEGGETEFLYYGKRIKPEKGKLLLWPASYPWTHRGNAPLNGSKYIITGWVEF